MPVVKYSRPIGTLLAFDATFAKLLRLLFRDFDQQLLPLIPVANSRTEQKVMIY